MNLKPSELRDSILTLAVAYPDACLSVIKSFFKTKYGIFQLSMAFDFLGLSYCKHLFSKVSLDQWKVIDSVIQRMQLTSSTLSLEQVLQTLYKSFLLESMSWIPASKDSDPFQFLRGMAIMDVVALLKGTDPTQIALVSAFWKPHEFAHLLRLVEPAKRRFIILQASRLESFSQQAVRNAADNFARLLMEKRDYAKIPPLEMGST